MRQIAFVAIGSRNGGGEGGKAHEANAIKLCAACNVKTHLGPSSNMYTGSASSFIDVVAYTHYRNGTRV